jgi:hypothetical protein
MPAKWDGISLISFLYAIVAELLFMSSGSM